MEDEILSWKAVSPLSKPWHSWEKQLGGKLFIRGKRLLF